MSKGRRYLVIGDPPDRGQNPCSLKPTRPDRASGLGGAAALCLALSLALAPPAPSAQTDPALMVSGVASVPAGGQAWVRVQGSYPFDDVTHIALPQQLDLLLRVAGTGTQYVRYDLATREAFTGSDPALADGFQPADAAALLLSGTPAPQARLLQLGPETIEILLPAALSSSSLEVNLFFVDAGGPIGSNALAFVAGGTP